MRENRGITLIALIITIIIMIVLATIVIRYSKVAIEEAKLEDLKTNMLLLQGKSKTVYEKFTFGDIETLPGIEYSPVNNTTTGYTINVNLQTILNQNTNAQYYIWEKEDFSENGLETIEVDNTVFYIVDYISGEIYYSLGYTKDNQTYYSLTQIQEL